MREIRIDGITERKFTQEEQLAMASRDLKTIKEIALNAAYVNDQTGEYGNSARVLIHIAEMVECIDDIIEGILAERGQGYDI